MPGIEEPEKQKNVRHLNAHGDKSSEGTECGQMPNSDCRYHTGNDKYPGIEQHKRLDQDLPAEVCHGRITSKQFI
jgi:hypothetical protein